MSRRVNVSVRVGHAAVLAAVLALLPAAAGAQTTVVVDAPGTQVGDARIQGGTYANTVFRSQPLATKVHPSNSTYHRRSVLKFDTHNTIPAGATVHSATLTLTISKADPETRRVGLYRLSQTFDEDYATWVTRKSGTRWATAGGDFDQKFAEASVGASAGAKVTFDITALVQGVVGGKYGSSRYTRVGLADLGSGSNTSYKEFYSSETSDAARRPALKVVYSAGNTATFDGGADEDEESSSTSIEAYEAAPSSVPSGWSARDVGAVGAGGSTSGSGSSFTVKGAGADVWGTADAFHYAYRSMSGDATITARVASMSGAEAWTKVGVMMRGSTSAGAAHAFMLVSKGKGLAFQRRTADGRTSSHTSGGSGAAPRWVRLSRKGSVITASASGNGTSWTTVGSATVSMPSTILVGLAVSSHDTGALASGVFDQVTVSSGATAAPAPEPEPEPEPTLSGTGSSTGSTLRVLDWNTHYGVGTDGRYNIDRIASYIAKYNPDVVSLNEVTRYAYYNSSEDQASRYAALLKAKTGRTWYYYYRTDNGASKGVGNMVLSRFPIASTSYCQLSARRVAVQASIHVNGRLVNVWSTHLDSSTSTGSYRIAEVKKLNSCTSNFAQQRIVAGDFNARDYTTEIGLMESGHYDGWAEAARDGTAVDYPGNTQYGATRRTRIDYVFYSKGASALVLKKAQVFDTRNSSGHMPSDHKPLLVTFEVR